MPTVDKIPLNVQHSHHQIHDKVAPGCDDVEKQSDNQMEISKETLIENLKQKRENMNLWRGKYNELKKSEDCYRKNLQKKRESNRRYLEQSFRSRTDRQVTQTFLYKYCMLILS